MKLVEHRKRASAAQTAYFYETLKHIAIRGDVPGGHLLKHLPDDPFARGKDNAKRQAVKDIERRTGNWSVKLRQLYYSLSHNHYRLGAFHQGIVFCTMYDSELQILLRSHMDDETTFPRVFETEEYY